MMTSIRSECDFGPYHFHLVTISVTARASRDGATSKVASGTNQKLIYMSTLKIIGIIALLILFIVVMSAGVALLLAAQDNDIDTK